MFRLFSSFRAVMRQARREDNAGPRGPCNFRDPIFARTSACRRKLAARRGWEWCLGAVRLFFTSAKTWQTTSRWIFRDFSCRGARDSETFQLALIQVMITAVSLEALLRWGSASWSKCFVRDVSVTMMFIILSLVIKELKIPKNLSNSLFNYKFSSVQETRGR